MAVALRRPAGWDDWWWLTRTGLSPELVGRQYHWAEMPLQLVIAPLRGAPWPRGPRWLVEVDGRRAGYVGRNPLSGNVEYLLRPWARGGGRGGAAITAFLRADREDGRPSTFFVAHHNARSRAALVRSLEAVGRAEGEGYAVADGRHGERFTVPSRPGR